MAGCAAGHSSRPSDAGAARTPEVVQERLVSGSTGGACGGKAVPSGQAETGLQDPEQAEVVRPDELPNVPKGHGEQTGEPSYE